MSKAEILVGNHHLLFANLRAGWEYLPRCQVLLVDEAHNLDTVASDCLGAEFSHRALRRVWEGLRGKDGEGCLIGALHELRLETRHGLLAQVREAEKRFGETVHWFHKQVLQGQARVVVSLETARLGLEHFLEPLSEVVASLKQVATRIEDEERALECNGYATRLERTLKEARTVIDMPPEAPWLLWCEEIAPRGRGAFESPATAIFHTTPIEPGDLLREQLYSAFEANILVSATLSVAGDFTYTRQRLGTVEEGTREISLPSPFNTKENLLVYSPSHLTEPSQFEKYIEDVTAQLVDLVGAASGGTFVLCTSYRILNALYDRFREEVPTTAFREMKRGKKKKKKRPSSGPILVLKQGESSRENLLDTFRKTGRAVLFGATTFWQGVDVPGQALELVVITRLPFQVPDDPVLEAKIQRCRNRGGNPFYEMQIPHAIVQFRQGIGRLIRSHSDRGAVALLDSRVVTKRYGQLFLESLPECRITDDPEEVKAFLQSPPASRS
jgi:ATP-dependent DNA helicase DinG